MKYYPPEEITFCDGAVVGKLKAEQDIIDVAMRSKDPAMAEQAFRQLDRLIESSSESDEKAALVINKAMLHGLLGQFKEARELVPAALALAPDDEPTRFLCEYTTALLTHEEGQSDLPKLAVAFAQFSALLMKYSRQFTTEPDLRSNYEDIQQRRGFELVRLKRFVEAIPVLKECLSFDLSSADKANVLANLGIACSMERDYSPAMEYLRQASKMDLSQDWRSPVHSHLGVAYARLGRFAEAKKEFLYCAEKISSFELSLDEIYSWLAWLSLQMGERTEAARYSKLRTKVN
jgi:tetratricopeptide (TPR) repeat protein